MRGEHLAGGFETGVGGPELGGEDEAAVGFGAAAVGGVWVCLRRATEIRRFWAC